MAPGKSSPPSNWDFAKKLALALPGVEEGTRLPKIDPARLEELLEEAWQIAAPKRFSKVAKRPSSGVLREV